MEMKQIDILWKFQEIENCLESEKKNLKEMSSPRTINQKIEMHKELKGMIAIHKDKVDECTAQLQKLETELEDLEYKGEELREKLYGGKINDLKQLGIMLKEQEKFESKNLEINKSIEEKMEQLEALSKEAERLKEQEQDIDKSIRKMVKQRKESKEKNELKLNKLLIDREKILSLISPENLEIYNYIKAKKNNPIATLDSNICQGCHMDLPIMTLSEMNRNEIVMCNNCGRILYNREG